MKSIKYMITMGFSFACIAMMFGYSISPARARTTGLSESEIKGAWKAFQDTRGSLGVRGNYPYMDCFTETAGRHDLPLALLLAVARGESNFDKKAKSSKECYGIMQLKWPGTANDMGITRKQDLFDPCKNIEAGGKYLAFLLERYEGDAFLAVAAYNYGPGRISDGNVPEGARWYAAYIYNHLQHVLSKRYEKTDRLLVLEFTYFSMASHYMEFLREIVKEVPFEIFKSERYTYDIFITYKSQEEREDYIGRLKEDAGLTPIGLR